MTRPTVGKPRGLLEAPPVSGVFAHERHAPPDDIAPFVEHFWMVSWQCPDGPVVREVLPHPSVHVVFERSVVSPTAVPRSRAEVTGVPRGRFIRTLAGEGIVFGIKFRPGCFRPFIDFPVLRLKGRVLPIEEVLGAKTKGLEKTILECPEMPSMIAAASSFLRAILPDPDPRAEAAAAAVRTILDSPDVCSVEALAARLSANVRGLQRLFGDYVGVNPKWVIRRYRLHEALERVNSGKVTDWASLAQELGYCDQAHFIRDFKAMVGRAPADYQRSASLRARSA